MVDMPEVTTKSAINKAEFYRALANFYEEHPDIPFGDMWAWVPKLVIRLDSDKAKDLLLRIGSFEKEFEGSTFTAKKIIGGVRVDFNVNREAVCERIVTGTKHVEAQMVPESVTPARFIEAHNEEIVEWHCPESVLQKAV